MSREIDWDRVALLYADRSVRLKEIARQCGVPTWKISRQARQEGWPVRVRRAGAAPHRPNFRTMIARMFRALDKQMREIEARLAPNAADAPDAPDGRDAPPRTATDREKDARTLASLIRTLQKLRALEREAKEDAAVAKAARAAKAANDGEAPPDRAALRSELERRLAGLFAAAGEDSISDKPD